MGSLSRLLETDTMGGVMRIRNVDQHSVKGVASFVLAG